MGFKFVNGAPLFRNGKPSLCCCSPDEECTYRITFQIRGGLIFGQMDGGTVVSSYGGTASPGTYNAFVFTSGALGEALTVEVNDYAPHTFRVWGTAASAGDIDINRITIEALTGNSCIEGVSYTGGTGDIFDDLIPIVEDPGFPSDQSSLTDGIEIESDCGTCPP